MIWMMYAVVVQGASCCIFIIKSHVTEKDVIVQANARADGHL